MEHFAGYGFNKSHSTAYAFLAYQTAYLKANYPWHFAAALLTIEAQNTDKLALYLGECRERGIPVLPPDINESQLRFTVEPGKGVRFGLTAIKNVGEGAIESLLEVRKKQGRIASLARAVRGPRSAAGQQARLREPGQGRRLRFAGAGRAPRYEALPSALAAAPACGDRRGLRARRPAPARSRAKGRRSCSAFDAGGRGAGRARPQCRGAARAHALDRDRAAGFEKETLGLYWSGHPVDRYATALTGVRREADRASWPTRRSAARASDAWGAGGRSRSSRTPASAASSRRAGS